MSLDVAALSDQLGIFKDATYWKATGKLGKGFGVAYPDDASKVQAYIAQLDAGHFDAAPPTGLTTLHAQGLVGMLAVLAAEAAKPTLHISLTGTPQLGKSLMAAIA